MPSLEDKAVNFVRDFLSDGLRYYLSLLAFWPTVLFNRIYCAITPKTRQLWNNISGISYLSVGSVPLFESDYDALAAENVSLVINLCMEWKDNEKYLAKHKMNYLYLPTIDFDPPSYDSLRQAVDAIKGNISSKTYVHCKAGKGRSVAVCIAALMEIEGMKPMEADALIRLTRPHISQKWKLDVMNRFMSDSAKAL